MTHDSTVPRLTTAQAAARLGVKPATLYAYVARGLIASIRADTGGSTFDALEVEAFARSRRRAGERPGRPRATGGTGRPLMVVDSPLTLLDGDRLYFRGVSAVDLARRATFEEGLEFLWNSGETPGVVRSDPELASRVASAGELLGPASRPLDRMMLAVVLAGSCDPLRDELSPAVVRSAGRRMISAMVDALPRLQQPLDHSEADSPLARRLWARLTGESPSEAEIALLDQTLILCLDHDLAAATMAARIAASARAHPYAAVQAALGAFDSSLHGSASIAAADMIASARNSGHPERALAEQLRAGRAIPGFGHLIYREHDPRAEAVFAAMRGIPRYHDVLRTVDRLDAIMASRSPRPANIDLALAAFALGAGMGRGAGQLIFAIARTGGWIAHIVDEYGQAPMRLRPESRYTGPAPQGSLPPTTPDLRRLVS